MKKLNRLFAILIAVLGVGSLSAQEWTDKTSLIANPSFESQTGATDLTKTWNSTITDWTFSPSSSLSNSQVGVAASNCTIQGIATSLPTADGGNYFYVRTNWNNDPTFALSQVISGDLPAGLYRLTCMAASNSGNWSTSTFNLTLKEGDGNISTNSSLNKCSEWTEWTVELYKGDPTTSLTIEATMRAGSSGGSQHYQMLLDDFKLEYMSFDDIEAAGWPKPQVPGSNLKSFVGTSVVAALYNVGSDAFITRGMTWGTQAIATKLHNSDIQAQSASDRHHVKVSVGDGDLVRFTVNGKNYLGDGGQGSTTTVYTDNGNTSINQFSYSELNKGTYKLKVGNATSDENAFLDVSQPYGGQLTYANGQGFTEWAIIKFSDIENGKYASYKAKKAMYEVYKAVVDAGHSATFSDALRTALATYIKPNATASDVTAATNVLIKAVAPALTAGYVNVGALFTNPDMRGAGDKSAWTSGYTNVSWGCIENWHNNAGSSQLTQTQTQLPNGFYKIVYHGIWRQDGSDAGPVLTLSSNGKSASANVPCMTDVAWGVGNTNGSNNWTNTNGKIIPNGMQSGGEALSHGGAQATVSDFVVSNGELTIDVNTSSGTQWLLAQGFDIYYKAESMEEYANLFNTAKAAANAIDASTLNTYAANILSNALSNAATEQINKEWYQARTAELNAAVALANEVKAPYANFKSLITLCESTLNNSEEFEAGAANAFTTAINTAEGNVASATTASAINEAYNKVEEARRTYIQKADPLNGTLFDYTFKITNPGFDNGTNGWNCESNAQNKGIASNKTNGIITDAFFENWKGENFNGTISQSISGLPSGKYLLKVAAFGNGAYAFANDEKTTITTGDGAWYEVEVAVSEGTLTFGIKNESATNWMGIDNASLSYKGFDVETAKNGITNLVSQAEALAAEPMNKEVLATLNQTIGEAENVLNAANPTRKELNGMVETLNQTIENTKASIAEYQTIAGYIAKADGINESIASAYKTQHANGTISESLETIFQNLEVATYKYVMGTFTYPVALSDDWNSTGNHTHAATFYDEHWSGERRAYKNQHDGWGDPKEGFPANEWSIDFDQSVTLPAGEYVFKVAGRKSADATLELVVTMGETVLGTVNDFPSSNEALGINKAGAASFDANDFAGFSKDGKGHGWQWRYVRFVLEEEAAVKVAIHAETNKIYNWVSFGDYTLQMSEETYLEANKDIINTAVAAAEALVNTLPMGDAEKEALQTALDMTYETGAEMQEKTEALNTAVANAKAWVTAYNNAKPQLVEALERFEADFNDAENGALAYLNKNIWDNVIKMAQAVAEAKDVLNSYDGFETAAKNLNDALDAAQASITAYAALEIEVNSANTPVIADNIENHAKDFSEAKNGYNNATIETSRANELTATLQNYRVEDYNYVVENYSTLGFTGEWTGYTNTQKGEHWSGDSETTYFDCSRWSGANVYEAQNTVTLPAGEYVLMAAGRASAVTGTEAYIKVDDTKVNFAAKGAYGFGIATDGTASYAADGTYARNNEGFGWEYRFIAFSLEKETEVTLVAGMTIADSWDPLSWASVCTPVLLTPNPDVAREELNAAITEAENVRDNAYPLGEDVFEISMDSEPYTSLDDAIATAQNVRDEATTVRALLNGINTLNAEVENYLNNYVLNAPTEDQRFYIKVATEGHGKYGNAVLATLGNTGDNNPTGYGLNANNAVKTHLNQAFIFTQVEGNLYNISIERAEGTVYLTYGSLNGSAAGWNQWQIQATTDEANKGTFKIEATAKESILKIQNTITNEYLDCQDGGSIYTDTNIKNEEFAFELASESVVTLTLSKVGWATLILPFNAELPDGVQASSCGEVDGETLELVEAESIKANTPYLMSGNPGQYHFSGYGLADKDSYEDGLFRGTYVDYKTTANSNTYVLQNIGGDAAFYLVGEEQGQPTVGAYRCYMVYESAAGAPKFSFGRGGNTTGIDNSQFAIDNSQLIIYDLMGRKVNTMEKGKMYIVNGKKVIVK